MDGRYARQIILPEIGAEGQARLAASRVLCVGAGGLGSPALLYLAAAGIGTIGIIDHDRVALSNLQRQILFTTQDVDRAKAGVAAQKLTSINPNIRVVSYNERLGTENASQFFRDYDIVLDGTDNFEAKFLINDTAVAAGLPVVYGSILGFEGQIATFWAKHGPCYRCLYPQPPTTAIPNCAEAGVLGAVAGWIGVLQAMEVIKLALGLEHCARHGLQMLLGRIGIIDARDTSMRTLTLSKVEDCPMCSETPREKPRAAPLAICVSELSTLRWDQVTKDMTLVDVREPEEWAEGHVPSSLNFPLSVLRNPEVSLPPFFANAKNVALYCRSGVRSQEAFHLLMARGVRDLFHIEGGIKAWPAPTSGELP